MSQPRRGVSTRSVALREVLGLGRVCDSRVVARLDHIRWVGGGTGAGKTTVVRRLAERSGLSIYGADETIRVHSSKLSATAAPLLDRFRRMSMDERWVLREPVEMYRTFPWFQGEGFELLIEDLESLPTGSITRRRGSGCSRILSAHCCLSRVMRYG